MRFIAAALVAVSSLATVAQAGEIAGPRVEAVLGYDDVEGTSGFLFGLGLGYDLAVAQNVALGADVELTESTGSVDGIETGRDIYVGARLTTKVAEQIALFAKAGYTNARFNEEGNDDFATKLDGFRIGAGVQYLLGANTYVGAEYRYSAYNFNVERHQVAANIGYRF